jgi:CRP/FNR family transcriptional regulator, cyclic AMP receptor protein
LSVSSVPRLSGLLPPAEWSLVESLAIRRKYRDGETIHERGDQDQSIGIVIAGRVKLINPRSDGLEVFSGLIHTGQNYGDAALLHNQMRQHRAVAIGETVIDHLESAAFNRLLGNAAIARAFYIVASYRLSVSLALLDDMRTLAPEVRLGRLILRMHQAAEGSDRLDFLQEEFAGMLGISTVTLAKALRQLTRHGFIATGYRHIRINHPVKLATWLREHEMK